MSEQKGVRIDVWDCMTAAMLLSIVFAVMSFHLQWLANRVEALEAQASIVEEEDGQ
jgi:hypothetical protein